MISRTHSVSYTEFRNTLLRLKSGFSEPEIELLIDSADRDKDGEIDYAEMCLELSAGQEALFGEYTWLDVGPSWRGTDRDGGSAGACHARRIVQ